MSWCRHGKAFAFTLTTLMAVPQMACADYAALSQELETYQPPVVFTSQLTSQPPPPPAEDSISDSTFKAQIDAMRLQQDEWRQTLVTPKHEDVFYPPDTKRMAELQPAAEDAAVAGRALTNGFTLETLELLILLRNPSIKDKEHQFQAALQGYSQVEHLDSSLRQYATLTKSLMTGVGGMTDPDPTSLKFPFPGVLALKGEIVNQEVRAAQQDLEVTRREALTKARKDYAELLYTGQAQEVTKTLLQLMDGLRETASAGYRAGRTEFQEVTAIDIEREKLHEELTTLVEEHQNGETTLRAALALPPHTPIGHPERLALSPLPVRPDALLVLALERRQELKGQQAMIGRMERMLEMSETMIYPGGAQELSLFDNNVAANIAPAEGGMGQPQDSFPATTSASTNGAGLPKMAWFGTNDAYLQQTRQKIAALTNELSATKQATLLEVRLAWFRLDKASRQKSLYQDRIITLAQANLDAALQGYSAAQSSFEKLIAAASSWLTAKLTLARTNSDLVAAAAELDAAVGATAPGLRTKR